jgi:hypothetical protein
MMWINLLRSWLIFLLSNIHDSVITPLLILIFFFFASAMLVDTTEMPPKFCSFSLGCWLRFSDISGCLWILGCYSQPAKKVTAINSKKIDRFKSWQSDHSWWRSDRPGTEASGLTGPWWRSDRHGLSRPPEMFLQRKFLQGIQRFKFWDHS